MKLTNTLLIVFAAIFVFGCGMMSEGSGDGTATAPAEESVRPIVGETVVAKWVKNSFYEGKVESSDGTKFTVKWSDGSSATKVDDSDVFALPKADASPDVEVGDIVLAKIGGGSYWNGAEVIKVDGKVFEVKAVESGSTSYVSGAKIIIIPDDVAANLKQKAGSTDFLKAAHSKAPEAPSGFNPKKGDKVLGEWSTNSWWAGKVEKTDGSKTTIAWEDGSTASAIATAKVIPFPTAKDSKMPDEKQYLLIKPASGTKWIYAQAASVKDSDVEAKTATGESRTVKAGEFVALN
jgi:hypothetical protein